MLSHAVKVPEIALTENEAEQLANAASKVARHYDITASQKAMDWGNLMIALAVIYGPRMVLIGRKKKETVKNPVTQNTAPVDINIAAINNMKIPG